MPTLVRTAPALAGHRGVEVLAVLREVPRTQPLADDLELGTVLDVPAVDRGDPLGVEQLTPLASGERREQHRRVRRAVVAEAHLADLEPQRRGDDATGVDARGLALVLAGADRGVALDVLDTAHAGTRRAPHVGDALVAVQVDEVRVPLARLTLGGGHQPQLARLPGGGLAAGAADGERLDREAGRGGSRAAGERPVTEHLVEDHGAAAGTDDPLVLDRAVRDERGERGIPPGRALALGVQVHQRAPATRDREHVGVDGLERRDGVVVGDRRGVDPRQERRLAVGLGPLDGRPAEHADTRGDHLGGARRQGGAGVQDGDDLEAGRDDVLDHVVRAVVGGGHHEPATGRHGVAVEVGAHGTGEHDAGDVVAGEDQRALVGAVGQDHLGRADVPDPLAGDAVGLRGGRGRRSGPRRRARSCRRTSRRRPCG